MSRCLVLCCSKRVTLEQTCGSGLQEKDVMQAN